MAAIGKLTEDMVRSGVLVGMGGLKPSSQGAHCRLAGGKVTVTDGPFAEAKEIVGGYAIVEVKSEQEALDLATQFMELHRIHWPEFEGESELRPVETGEPGSE